ncbi:ABC transporter substrate-binding protein [Salinirubellus salinus]|uniref:ABC transporter substrate-binding protein n=1 Tax=Salinirubellus salinus TaxID=1364945 RepID=A0A9E7R1K3_9EURY|nr:ABC transporter substrate-binding protein [Salinirubellus salinus]UWM53818.1 ABC transporter substrate-binding protein [Salinirubellus salinus]
MPERPTRRDVIKYGGIAGGAGMLAGCASQSDSGATPEGTETDSATETATPTADPSYTAELFPVGEVEFESVPQSVTTYNMGWADMVVSLGQADTLRTNRLSAPTLFYDRFDVEWDNDYPALWQSGGWSKEVMYERDPDVFLFDPNLLTQWDDNWAEEDTAEIEENVAPFFGCHNRRIRGEWQQELGYPEGAPTMLEAFETVGTVLDEEARAQAWLDLHDDLQSAVQPRIPDGETPSIALINSGSAPANGEFYVLNLAQDGYEMKPYRDLGLVEADAFEGVETGQYGLTDYETMLEVDPDIILVHWGITQGSVTWGGDGAFDAEQFHEKFVAPMEEDDTGSELTAVQEGRVLPGPTAEQGPLVNAFQTELVARLFYPEEFGELDLDAPLDVPEEERLFSRERVVDILAGDL